MIFSRDHVPDVQVFIVLFVFYRQLGTDVNSFWLNFVVDFILYEYAGHFPFSVELSKSSYQYFVGFHPRFGTLAVDLLVYGGGKASESRFSPSGMLYLGYF